MDEETFISLSSEYYIFRKQLVKNLKTSKISIEPKDCYLIEESWINDIINSFNKYDNLKKQKRVNHNFNFINWLPENDPEFINDIPSILNCIKNNKKFKLVSKILMEYIYDKKDLVEEKYIKYYSGNNKLIIEYKENGKIKETNDHKAFFIINPCDLCKVKKRAFIITIKNRDKLLLYKELLSKDDFDIESMQNNNDIVFFEVILPKQNNSNNNINNINSIKNANTKSNEQKSNRIDEKNNSNSDNNNRDILKLFIYIFYYEKSLLVDNKDNIFDENKDYYLINPDWLNKYKEYYDYQKLYKCLNTRKINSKKIEVNYSNLDKFINSILKIYSEKNLLNFKKNVFDTTFDTMDSLNIDDMKPPSKAKNNIVFYTNCYIIDSKIFDLILKIFQKEEIDIIKKKKIYSKNNNIYIMYLKKIIIGILNNELIFIPKYILSYDTPEIFESEKKIIQSETLEKYITSLNCDLDNFNLQDLKQYNKKLGQLIIRKDKYLENSKKLKGSITKSRKTDNSSSYIKNKIKSNLMKSPDVTKIKMRQFSADKNSTNSKINSKIISRNNSKSKSKSKSRSKENSSYKKSSKSKKNINLSKISFGRSETPKTKNIIHSKSKNDLNKTRLFKQFELSTNRINELNESNINMKEELKAKEKELKNMIKKLDTFQKQINNLEEKNKEKDNKLTILKNSNKKEETNEKLEQLKEDNNKLKELNIKIKKKLSSQAEEIEDQYKKLDQFKQTENKLINANKKLQKQIDDLEMYNKKKEEEIFNLQNNYKNLIKEKDNEIKNLKNKYNNLQKELEKKDRELNDDDTNIKNEIKNSKKINKKLNKEIKDLKEINKEKENQIQILKKKNKVQENEINNILMETENEIKSLKKLNNEYKNRIDELLGKINNKPQNENNKPKDINVDKKTSRKTSKKNNKKEESIIILKKESERKKSGKDILVLYSRPIFIGLNNIGATCFMNSTLQCLSQTKPLTNFFLNKSNKSKIINNNYALKNEDASQLSPAFLELIQKLWDKNGEKAYSPNKFMDIVAKMNPLFRQGQAGDSKDFILFILQRLHKELKKIVNSEIESSPKKKDPLDQYDKNIAFNEFYADYKDNSSIISDIFFGFLETTNECLKCKKYSDLQGVNNPTCYKYGIFKCLIFPLEEVKNMKNNSLNLNNIQHEKEVTISLDECFIYNQKSDLCTGDNRHYCNICKKLCDSIYTTRILLGPEILIIILDRGKGNIYDIKLDFSETINLTQFILQKEKAKVIYNLYGVITHVGKDGPNTNAHFVASCKSPIDYKWYRYNDALIKPITDVQSEVIEYGTPYILFYEKKN